MRPSFSSSAATPVPVVIGGTAIIATRIIGVLLLVAELGFSGVSDFISDSLQRWDTGLIFCQYCLAVVGYDVWCCGVSPPKLGALVLSDLSVDHHDLPAYGFTELVGARYFPH